MNNPKISVIIVYNNENNLYDCIQSAVQQSFSNIEVICVNNGAKDNSENIAKELCEKIDRIKLVSLPSSTSNEAAKKTGTAVAMGEFIIFIENNEIVSPDFLKNAYVEAQENKQNELKNKYLYRRTFVENDREISALVQDRINAELERFSGIIKEHIEEQKQKITEKFDFIEKNNIEIINNKTYEITNRFNALEKLFYAKDYEYRENINSLTNTIKSENQNEINKYKIETEETIKNLLNKINELANENNLLKEEIKKLKDLTEKKIQEAISNNGEQEFKNRVDVLEKEIIMRYVNLKRIMDLQFDEIKAMQNGG